MSDITKTIIRITVAFLAVSLDELFTLILFYATVLHGKDSDMILNDIIIGQLLGFSIIVILSLSGRLFLAVLSMQVLCLIGIVPLLIGCQQLYKVVKFWMKSYSKQHQHSKSDPEASVETVSLDIITKNSYQSVSEDCSQHSDNESDSDSDIGDSPIVSLLKDKVGNIFNTSTLIVCATILSEETEEVGVFLPIIASSHSNSNVFLMVITLYILLGLMNLLAYSLVQHRKFGSFISKYSKNIVPFILIGLGVYVLSNSTIASYF